LIWGKVPVDRKEIVSFNAVRGIASLAVCVSHLRAFLMVNFPFVDRPSQVDKLFYFMTGLGHQSVVVFFVMSGWLVGSSVWNQQLIGRFSWSRYAITRLARLWVVLIPTLALTACLDAVGIWSSGGYGYDGSQISRLMSGPSAQLPLNDSALTALGNLAFLQTLLVPVYGSNIPLWSLANEFWYYVMFPLFVFAWFKRRSRVAIGALVPGALVLVAMPFIISAGFAIWLMGWAGSRAAPRSGAARVLRIVSALLLVAGLVASKTRSLGIIGDFLIGIPVAGLLIGLRVLPDEGPLLRRAGGLFAYLSHISFTLYLVHFPLLAFVFFSWHLPQQQPTLLVYAEFAALLFAVVAVASGLWYAFERNTDAVRRFVYRVCGDSPVAVDQHRSAETG
jgi:peptidoglycan/LPS O-acetylase OafA/YrhL